MDLNKKELKEKFTKDWEKHYKLDFFKQHGFERKKCRKCGNYFWTLDNARTTCADATCVGYEFIGKATKKLDYVECWKKIEEFFVKKGLTSIKRYPTVCRWRDDLYFTNASIIDFQPYVVSGEVEPPANPLVVPQTSIRFGDIANVGFTGRHYTCFVMVGQHAFNSKKTGLFYWKEEALEHDFELAEKVLGAKKEDIVFQEEVWAGGGNFGPSIEFCVDGVELGNCVFMQYKNLGNGKFEELQTKVIDMGAGLERMAWFTNGTATSYDVAFGPVIEKMKHEADAKIEEKLFLEYARISGSLALDSLQEIEKKRKEIAGKLGVGERELFEKLERIQALYAIADHLKTVLYTTTDGMLPSNSGGGYNIRMILRRVFGFNEELRLGLDFAKILEMHARYLKKMDETVELGLNAAINVVGEEEKKYNSSLELGRKKIEVMASRMKKEGKKFSEKELTTLYESDGIAPETVKELAQKEGLQVEIPADFYSRIAKKDEVEKEKAAEIDVSKYEQTRMLFYDEPYSPQFTAVVLGKEENYLVLDQTLFYAESGGQAGDRGKINGVEAADTQKVEGVVLHEMKSIEQFKKGQKIIGEIDWERRASLMKHHSATHLVNAAARELLGMHVWQAGAFKEADKAHIDLTHYRRISQEELQKIETEVNKMIQQSIPVEIEVLERTKAEQLYGFRIYQGGFVPGKQLRIVKVKGIDVQACGGTHVKNTSEIGFCKILKRQSVKDGVERITFSCGLPALKYVQEREDMLSKAAENLNVQEAKLPESAKKFFGEWKELRKEKDKLQEQLVELKAEKLLKQKEEVLASFNSGFSVEALTKLCERIVREKSNATCISASEEGIVIIAGEKSKHSADELLKKLQKKAKIKGGGNKGIARGKAENVEELKKALGEFK